MSSQADAAAAQVAAQVSLLYPAPHFLVLRIGLLGGHPIQAHELVALEAGVQKAVGRLEAQIDSLKQELELERAHNTHGTARAQAQLAAQLAASRANEQALQQMLDQARADALAVKQQLRDTQQMLEDSQQALAAAAGVTEELRVRVSYLEQQQQRADDAASAQRQQQQQQQAEVAASTPVTSKAQTPMPLEQPADTAADTLRQPDQRTPQAMPSPQHLLLDAAQQDQQGAPQHTPVVRHVPSPLLSPSPLPDALRRSGRESPLTPQLASRIPVAPEAAAKQLTSLSYAAALARPQAAALEGPAATAGSSSTAGRLPAVSSRGDTGSKPSDFKFTAAPYAPPAVGGVTGSSLHRPFGAIYRPFTTGTLPSSTTLSRFGSSGTGSISSRRRAVRSGQGGHSNRGAKVQPPPQRPGLDISSSSSRLPRALPEPDGHTDSNEARKRRWR